MVATSRPADPLAAIESALQRGAEQRPQSEPLLLDYGRVLLRNGPWHFFGALSPQALAEFVAQRLDFVRERVQQPFSLRLAEGPGVAGGDGAAGHVPAFEVIEIVADDRPFLIDSIQSFLFDRDTRVQAMLHPILAVKRDAAGRLLEVADYGAGKGKAGSGATVEAHMCFLVDPVPAGQRQALLEELRAVLHDVVRCVDDFPALKAQLERLHQEAKAAKGTRSVTRLMQWFQDGSFVFMGYLPFQVRGGALTPRLDDGLGLFHPALSVGTQHEALLSQGTRFLERALAAEPFFLVEETTIPSRVHRRGRLTALLTSCQPAAERTEAAVLVGIFTDRSLRVDALDIPVVDHKITEVVRRRNITPESYKEKEVLDFFNGLPRYELFRLSEAMLERILAFFLSVVDQPRVDVALLDDDEEGTLRLLVCLPGRQSPVATVQHIRERVESLLNRTAQNLYQVQVSSFGVLGLVFYHPPGNRGYLPDAEALDRAVREELLSRDDRLVRGWLTVRGSGLEERLARTLVEGLPEEYKVAYPEAEVHDDLSRLEALVKTDAPQFVLREAPHADGVKLVLYGWEKLSLSRLMPVFSNLRVTVEEEETFEVRLPERPAFMHTFLLDPPAGRELVPDRHMEPLRDLIFNILANRAENDPLNALLLSADFTWRQVDVMQLYRNYLMQVGTVYTKSTINETLIRRPRAARALWGLFRARFDPELEGRESARKEAETELDDAEREIDNLTEDRIFKGLANLVQATLRTSFYQDADSPVVAVKLSSAAIEQLPAPRPLYEIYVYGPLMEGIHLRGDRIARGGIRYSDRPDDFRTEVLGLMATQMKKNALIVPLGSKGGFVVKDTSPWEGNPRAAGDAQYRIFIGALLSLTDNWVADRVVPPPRVVRHDEDDPYLVVAADKGTAHLSDTANAVSQEYGFWLDDAFASGGSHGYDHKAVGITARGAWESVKRLFWEQGTDVQRDPTTVVGIGDMSGDVFGNGLLASHALKLVGAFDHRHIFLDPDPDPEASYAERERLFRLPRSSWDDYDAKRISKGGGVFPRGAKAIPLSPRLRELLDVEAESLSGEEVIRALLRAPVDLLWNGGIGTYVKASGEINAEVGDPNNDAVRVDATELQVRIVGEGGNLGFTQPARIEFDLSGGGIHTDAIDNAGGVNMSDHEVNLKILMAALIEDGQLEGREARNTLLAHLEPAVTASVLRANFRQVLILSMDRLRSVERVDPFIRLVDLLAAQGGLDRRTEAIPNTQRFQGYQSDGHGVPRPVLAVLLAYTKMLLYRRLVADESLDHPEYDAVYHAYFPTELQERFNLEAVRHALRRQIVATVVTNRVVDQAGLTFVPEMAALTGRSWPEVARAYLQADAVVDGPAWREQIYALATAMPADVQYRLLMELEDLLEEMVRWLLLAPDGTQPADTEAPQPVPPEDQRREFTAYCKELPALLDADTRADVKKETDALRAAGLGAEPARLGALMPHLLDYPLVCGLAGEDGIAVPEAYALVNQVDERFRIRQLETALTGMSFGDAMQKRFGDGLLRTLAQQVRAKTRAVLALRAEGESPADWVEAYLGQRAEAWATFDATARQVLGQERPELVALAVLIDHLQRV